MKTPAIPIKDRIKGIMSLRKGVMPYHESMRAVFPEDLFPKAWEYQANGGPPGCAMAFGKALRELGGRRDGDKVYLLKKDSGMNSREGER